MRHAVATLLVLGLAALASSTGAARAQDSPSTADDLLEQAIRLREQRRDAEALPLFRRAYEMWPSPRCEAQLGLAHQAVGAWAEAYRHLSAALAARGDPWIASRRAPLEEALRVVRAEVALVALRGGPQGGQVFVGGRVVATLPAAYPVAVTPGRVTLELRAPGHVSQTRTFDAVRGQQLEQSAELALDPGAAAAAPMPGQIASAEDELDRGVRGRRRARRGGGGRAPVWAWVAAGGAVALAAGGGIAWWRAEEAYADLEAGCGRTRACTDAQIDDSGAPTLVTLTNVLLVGGAVVAAGAVVLFVVESSGGGGDDDDGRAGASVRASVGIG
ncbi:MAG: hypothetical protein IT379_04225, partial [Deltaproteobacteria bacterium]|nr:hypothetical protein [Deltaproteobacteria bacterium]